MSTLSNSPASAPRSTADVMKTPVPLWEQMKDVVLKGADGIKDNVNKLLNNVDFKESEVKKFVEQHLVDNFGVAFDFKQIGTGSNGTRKWIPEAKAVPIQGGTIPPELQRKVDEINATLQQHLVANPALSGQDARDPNRFTLLFVQSLGKAKFKEVPSFTGTDTDRHSLLILARNERMQNLFLKKGINGTPVAPGSMNLQEFSTVMQQWGTSIPLDGYTQTLLNAQRTFSAVNASIGADNNEKAIHDALQNSGKDRIAYHKNLLESYDGKTKKDLDGLKKTIMTSLGIDSSSLAGGMEADEHILMRSGKELMDSDTPAQDILDRLGKGVKSMNALEFAGLLFGSIYLFMTDKEDGKIRKGLMGAGAALILAKPASSLILNDPMGLPTAVDTIYGDTKSSAAKYMKNIQGYVSSLPGPLREFFQKNPEFVNGMQAMSHLEVGDMQEIVLGTAGGDSFEQMITILEKKLSGSGLQRHQIESWMRNAGFADGAKVRSFMEEIILGAANVGHIPRESMSTEERTKYLRAGLEQLRGEYGVQESMVSVMIMQAAKGELRNFRIDLGETVGASTEQSPGTPPPPMDTTPPATPQNAPQEQTLPAGDQLAQNQVNTQTQSFPDAGGAAASATLSGAAGTVGVARHGAEVRTGYAEGIPHRSTPTLDRVRSILMSDGTNMYLGAYAVELGNRVNVNNTSVEVISISGRFFGDVDATVAGKAVVDGRSVNVEPLATLLKLMDVSPIRDKGVSALFENIQFDANANRFHAKFKEAGLGSMVFYYHPSRRSYVMEKIGNRAVLGTENEMVLSKVNIEKALPYMRMMAQLDTVIPGYSWQLRPSTIPPGRYLTEYQGIPLEIWYDGESKKTVWKKAGVDTPYPLTALTTEIPRLQQEQERTKQTEVVNDRILQNRLARVREVMQVYNDLGLDVHLPSAENPAFVEYGKNDTEKRSIWLQSRALGYMGIRLDFQKRSQTDDAGNITSNFDAANSATNPDVLVGVTLGNGNVAKNKEVFPNIPLAERAKTGLIGAMNDYYFGNTGKTKILSFDGAGISGHLGKKGTVTLEVEGTRYPGFDLTNLPTMEKDITDVNMPSTIDAQRKQDIQDKKDAYFQALPKVMGVADGSSQIVDMRFGDLPGEPGKYIYAMAYDVQSGVRVLYTWEYTNKEYKLRQADLMEGKDKITIDVNNSLMSQIIGKVEQSTNGALRMLDIRNIKTDLPSYDTWRGPSKPAESDLVATAEYHVYAQFHEQDALRGFWAGFNYHNLPKEIASKARIAVSGIEGNDQKEFNALLVHILEKNGALLGDAKKKSLDKAPGALSTPLRTLFAMGEVLKEVDTQWEFDAVKNLLVNPSIKGNGKERAERIRNVLHAMKGFRSFLKNPLDDKAVGAVRDLFDDQKWFGHRWVTGAAQAIGNTGAWTVDKFGDAWRDFRNTQRRATLADQVQAEIMGDSELLNSLAQGTPGEIRAVMIGHIEKILEEDTVNMPKYDGVEVRSIYSPTKSTEEMKRG